MKKFNRNIIISAFIFCAIIPLMGFFLPIQRNVIPVSDNFRIQNDSTRIIHLEFPKFSDQRQLIFHINGTMNFSLIIVDEDEYSNYLQEKPYQSYFEVYDVTEFDEELVLSQIKGEDGKIHLILNPEDAEYVISIQINQQYHEYFYNIAFISLILGGIILIWGYLKNTHRV